MLILYGLVLSLRFFIDASKVCNAIEPDPFNWCPIIEGMDLRKVDTMVPHIYISLTTISNRLDKVTATIKSLLRGSVVPTQIFLVVSEEPYMSDEGISTAEVQQSQLLDVTKGGLVSVVHSKNIGHHRKLLPLLSQVYTTNCLIITVDDDVQYDTGFVERMLHSYETSPDPRTVVAQTVRRIGICMNSHAINSSSNSDTPETFQLAKYAAQKPGGEWYMTWPIISNPSPHERNGPEMAVLPLGTGGVLYAPSFLHPGVIFDMLMRAYTEHGDDLHFRLATMAAGVPVTVAGTNGHLQESGQWLDNVPPASPVLAPGTTNTPPSHSGRKLASGTSTNANTNTKPKYHYVRDNDKMLYESAHYLAANHIWSFQSMLRRSLLWDRWSCVFPASLRSMVRSRGGQVLRHERPGRTTPVELARFLTEIAEVTGLPLNSSHFSNCGFFVC